MKECIFCKIVRKEIPADIVWEEEDIMVFKDRNPKAPIHFLIVPKEHIESVKSEGSEEVARQLIKVAKKVAENMGIPGYKLVFNVGREGGQIIEHLHLHFLAGDGIKQP